VNRKEYAEKMKEKTMLRLQMEDLILECTDEGVEHYFDFESDKKLKKKVHVLKKLVDGEDFQNFMQDYLDILEKLPRDENGNPKVAIDW